MGMVKTWNLGNRACGFVYLLASNVSSFHFSKFWFLNPWCRWDSMFLYSFCPSLAPQRQEEGFCIAFLSFGFSIITLAEEFCLFLNIKVILWGIILRFLFIQKHLSSYLLSGSNLCPGNTAVNQRILLSCSLYSKGGDGELVNQVIRVWQVISATENNKARKEPGGTATGRPVMCF